MRGINASSSYSILDKFPGVDPGIGSAGSTWPLHVTSPPFPAAELSKGGRGGGRRRVKNSRLQSHWKAGGAGRSHSVELRAPKPCRAPEGAVETSLASGITVRGYGYVPFSCVAHTQ